MKNKSFTLLLIIIFLLSASAVSFSQNQGKEKKLLNGGRPGNVDFAHRKHQTTLKGCEYCHSLYPKVDGSIDKLKASGKLKKKVVMENCQKCHSDRKRNNQKSGPIRCSGCHIK